MYAYLHAYIHTYIHTYTHFHYNHLVWPIYLHTYIHTYIHAFIHFDYNHLANLLNQENSPNQAHIHEFIYIKICAYTYTYTYIHEFIYINMCIHAYIHIHTYTQLWDVGSIFWSGEHTYIHTHTHTHTQLWEQSSRVTNIHTYIHTYMHIHTAVGTIFWSGEKGSQERKSLQIQRHVREWNTPGTCLCIHVYVCM